MLMGGDDKDILEEVDNKGMQWACSGFYKKENGCEGTNILRPGKRIKALKCLLGEK